MARIPAKLLANRAAEACKAIGLDYGPHYDKNADSSYRAVVGRVQLSKAFGGYDLEQVVNDGGAIKQVNGWCNRLSAGEMLAYLDGIILAAKALKPALKEGDRVRYSDEFCRSTSTTDAGLRDCASRRGVVVSVFADGTLCNVDWGDVTLQFDTATRSLVQAA